MIRCHDSIGLILLGLVLFLFLFFIGIVQLPSLAFLHDTEDSKQAFVIAVLGHEQGSAPPEGDMFPYLLALLCAYCLPTLQIGALAYNPSD